MPIFDAAYTEIGPGTLFKDLQKDPRKLEIQRLSVARSVHLARDYDRRVCSFQISKDI